MCPKCGKTVYFAEEVSAVGKKYHKLCLRCGKDYVGIIVALKEVIKTGSVTYYRSVVFSGYSGFCHDIIEILLKVVLNSINQKGPGWLNELGRWI